MLLVKMKKIVEKEPNVDAANAVITVPPLFTCSQRQAIIDAGLIAGFKNVNLLDAFLKVDFFFHAFFVLDINPLLSLSKTVKKRSPAIALTWTWMWYFRLLLSANVFEQLGSSHRNRLPTMCLLTWSCSALRFGKLTVQI